MKVETLNLISFRNYDNEQIKFSPESNIFIGPNGAGKTSILEAIYVMSFSRSYKAKDEDLIKYNKEFAKISTKISIKDDVFDHVMVISKQGKKISINKVAIRKISDFAGKISVVLFSPDDMLIFKNGPQERRDLLNNALVQLSSKYISDYKVFKDHLKYRNDYLKSLSEKIDLKEDINDGVLDLITENFIKANKSIYEARLECARGLERLISSIYQKISGTKDTISIEYQTNYENNLDFYKSKYKQDIILGTTQCGCQRDDLIFKRNNKEFEKNSSQGEQRMLAISIKLALCELVTKVKGEPPILLLDDVLSELDLNHQNMLLKSLNKETQIIITTTDLNKIDQNTISTSKVFNVQDGHIKEITYGR